MRKLRVKMSISVNSFISPANGGLSRTPGLLIMGRISLEVMIAYWPTATPVHPSRGIGPGVVHLYLINFNFYEKIARFPFSLFFLNQFTYSQKTDTATATKLLSGVFPTISGKDAAAFVYSVMGKEVYQLGEDAKKQEGVPQGTVTKYYMSDSKVYPGTERDYWIYVPKQYEAKKPACLMIFQDGENYLADSAFLPPMLWII